MSTSSAGQQRMRIKSQISCPHCWHEFSTDQILFISEHPDMLDDVKLGAIEQQRFVPYRFDLSGAALDPKGKPCHKLACPNCHLQVPRSLLYMPSFFISIAGAPASGKSYFFASMVWQLRKTMTRDFCMNFTDADPTMNRRIREYENRQFLGGTDPNKPVVIEKTDIQGDIYNKTLIDGHEISFAQPFSFTVSALPTHPFKQAERIAQTVCMYDNAGESFLPGADHVTQPVTRHLATSDTILFLFDPTQDLRFKNACKEPINDPQMNESLGGDIRRSEVNQTTVLTEMVNRIKTHAHQSTREKIKVPLIVVLTKFDAWQQLTKFPHYHKPWNPVQKMQPIHAYNVKRVEEYSQSLRALLLDLIPELVGTAEANVEKVTYIAVSATGTAPELGPPTQDGKRALMYRPVNIKPIWVEVPFFHAQTLSGKYCVPVLRRH